MSIRTRAGDMRHRVSVKRNTPTTNAFNEPIDNWVEICETYAGIEPLRGRERYAAMQVQAEEDVNITMRYDSRLSDLRPSDRIVFIMENKRYDIKSAADIDERQRRINVSAKLNIPEGV